MFNGWPRLASNLRDAAEQIWTANDWVTTVMMSHEPVICRDWPLHDMRSITLYPS